jgi:hypothetical protein
MSTPIHPTYLPFDRSELLEHFAEVANEASPERHLTYYEVSARRATQYATSPPTGSVAEVARATRLARQIEKDERFWIATALMTVFRERDRVSALTRLLTRCLGDVPPFDGAETWPDALGAQPRLFFEVNLPSPRSYQEWLAAHLDQRALVPWLRETAKRGKRRLEGATKADAMLIAPDTGFAVVFEAKVLSDTSVQVGYDALRNQIARNIDVLLDPNPRLQAPLAARRPDRSCLVLVTPEVFKQHPESRLYGWLMKSYQAKPDLLTEHLPHRTAIECAKIPQRLGWLTWEDFNRVRPGACPWLDGGDEAVGN